MSGTGWSGWNSLRNASLKNELPLVVALGPVLTIERAGGRTGRTVLHHPLPRVLQDGERAGGDGWVARRRVRSIRRRGAGGERVLRTRTLRSRLNDVGLQLRRDALALGSPLRDAQPLHMAGDDHRGAARRGVGHEAEHVRVGQHHAAVRRQGNPGIAARRCAVQPDAKAGVALLLIPLVGVVQRERAGAVERFEVFGADFAGDEVNAQRRFHIADLGLARAEFALAEVVARLELGHAVALLKKIQTRTGGIHHDGALHVGRQRHQIGGNRPGRGRCGVGGEAGQCLRPKFQNAGVLLRLLFRKRGWRGRGEARRISGAGLHDIAQKQLRQGEMRVVPRQLLGLRPRRIEVAGSDFGVSVEQAPFRAVLVGGCAQRGGEFEQGARRNDGLLH